MSEKVVDVIDRLSEDLLAEERAGEEQQAVGIKLWIRIRAHSLLPAACSPLGGMS